MAKNLKRLSANFLKKNGGPTWKALSERTRVATFLIKSMYSTVWLVRRTTGREEGYRRKYFKLYRKNNGVER